MRFAKQDWINLGLKTLASDGPDALTVDAVCEAANKTKGSFYFHFQTIEAFLTNITQVWLSTYTQEIIDRPAPDTTRLDHLNQLAARCDLKLETGIRQLAARSEAVQEVVHEADQMRADWLAQLYENSGNYNASEAKALAKIEIAAFTGFKLIEPDMAPNEARELYEQFLKLTGRGT